MKNRADFFQKPGKLLIFQILFACFFSIQGFGQTAELLPAAAFQTTLSQTEHAQLIDVRTAAEFKTGHLNQAQNYTLNNPEFKAQLSKLDKKAPVYVYCKGGGRSAEAVKQMQEMGFAQIIELKGGIMSWEQQELPVAKAETPKGADVFVVDDFKRMLAEHSLVLVDFYAEWCIPCKKMQPTLAKLKAAYAGKVAIERVDVEQAKELAKTLKIEGLPVVAIYRDGQELKRVNGYQSEKQLIELIESL